MLEIAILMIHWTLSRYVTDSYFYLYKDGPAILRNNPPLETPKDDPFAQYSHWSGTIKSLRKRMGGGYGAIYPNPRIKHHSYYWIFLTYHTL